MNYYNSQKHTGITRYAPPKKWRSSQNNESSDSFNYRFWTFMLAWGFLVQMLLLRIFDLRDTLAVCGVG